MIDEWLTAAGLTSGRLFRCVCRAGVAWGQDMTEKVVWHVVKEYAAKLGVPKVAPHDLRRSCAHLCHGSGGELEQIQFLLGHVSVMTTEKYLGSKQRLRKAVNDQIGIGPTIPGAGSRTSTCRRQCYPLARKPLASSVALGLLELD